MKRFLILLLLIITFATSACFSQNLSISVEKDIWEDVADLDAKVYFPKTDHNDRPCALVKVTLTNKLKNPLILEVGGLGVVAREEQESGEVWFYLPAQVKNFTFKCAEYTTPAAIPVRLKEGTVYRIVLNSDAIFETISNAVLSTNYLKIGINEPNATISIGRTKSCELLTQAVEGDLFLQLLEFGEYFYKVEHPLYETYFGKVVLDEATPKQEVILTPAFGFLDINSTPQGATVLMGGKNAGTTPCKIAERIPKGTVSLRLECKDYHSVDFEVDVKGDGNRQTVSKTLKPRFANITLKCPDPEAEIWINNELKGKGSWSGRLNSITRHYVETRRAGHHPQSINITVVDGEDKTYTLNAPVALYGTLNITTTPVACQISIDGKPMGETPIIKKLLVGSHEVTISKDGYLRKTFPVEIEHNKTLAIHKALEKGKLKAVVYVKCPDTEADIFINDVRKATYGNWGGVLEEGRYVIEARKDGCIPSRQEVVVEGTTSVNVSLPNPNYTFGEKIKRWSFNPKTHPYYSKYFAEATWNGSSWGGNLGLFLGKNSGGHLGVHGSFNSDLGFTVGPLVRLALLGNVESHIYSGVGYNSFYKLPQYELGVRLAYDFNNTLLNLSSISFATEYIGDKKFSKIGISLLPWGVFAQEYDADFRWHLGLMNVICDSDGFSMGVRFAVTPSTLGWYCSIGGVDYDGREGGSFTTGPIVSICSGGWTEKFNDFYGGGSQYHSYSLFAYGGVGSFLDKYSIEMGLGLSILFADFWVGCTSYGDKCMLNFGTGICW